MMKIFEVVDDGYYAAPSKDVFDREFALMVGDDNLKDSDVVEVSFDEAEKIMVAHLDENERPTVQKTLLKTMMDMLVEQNGEDFFCLATMVY